MFKNLAIFGIAFFLGMLVTAFCLWVPNSSAEWAAWAQAIGTIVAIGASAWLLHYQAGLQRRSRLRAIHAIVEMTVQAVTRRLEVPEGFEDAFNFFASLNVQEVRFAFDALCKIPLHEIDSADAVVQVGAAIEATRRIVAKLESEEMVGAWAEPARVLVGSVFTEEVRALQAASNAIAVVQ
jgi:hypothetical protein